MQHIAELLGLSAAEVLGTASFYEMFKREPVGKYVVNVCTSISCFLNGGDELLEHAEERLGTKAGGTSDDGLFTIEGYECIAACTEAPCLQVNYATSTRSPTPSSTRSSTTCAPGAATTSRRTAPSPVPPARRPDKVAGVAPPVGSEQPVWLRDTPALQDSQPA